VSRLSKILYPCLILLLAWLAVAPHWPTIREEAESFYAAWQQVRSSGKGKSTAKEEDASAGKETTRERALTPPNPVAELPPSPESESSAEALDPFIREARERAQEDPEAAMQWLQEQGTGEERLRGMLEVVALWAAKDSESALLWLESNAQGLARLETLHNGVELWAARDPDAAAGWIEGMANDGSKIVAAKSLAASWGSKDPDKASAWLETLPDGEIKSTASLAFVETWAEKDPRAASSWALSQTQTTGDNRLLQNSLRQYALENPTGAEAFARQIAETEDAPNGISAYVNARAEIDPAGTADWLTSLAPGDPIKDSEYYDQYTRSALATWTETDSIAASAWLSEQAPGPKRDAAVVGFSESIRRFEPEAAVAWANTISNPTQRTEQLTKSIRSWAANDPQEALDWVIGAELAPDLQEQLAREIGVE